MRLTNKRGKYYARLRVWNGVKEKDSLIPLQTRLKTDAIRRFKFVQSHENDLKSGIIQKFQYEDYFEWMNDEGVSKLIKRKLNDVIPDKVVVDKLLLATIVISPEIGNGIVGYVGPVAVISIAF